MLKQMTFTYAFIFDIFIFKENFETFELIGILMIVAFLVLTFLFRKSKETIKDQKDQKVAQDGEEKDQTVIEESIQN